MEGKYVDSVQCKVCGRTVNTACPVDPSDYTCSECLRKPDSVTDAHDEEKLRESNG